MIAPDSMVATTDAALANERQGWKDLLEDRDRELRAAWAESKAWVPDQCHRPMCRHRVPNRAQVAQFRALGATWDEVQGFAWEQGFCSVECSEAMRPEEPSNVVPFARGAP